MDQVKKDLRRLLQETPGGSAEGWPPYVRGEDQDVLEWFRPFANTVLAHVSEFATEKEVILVTACSYAKPYSHSFIHYCINQALYKADLLDRVEKWHLSSAGIIPEALEEEPPFCCYDWNNENATEEDKKVLRVTLADYFRRWLRLYVLPGRTPVVTYFRCPSNTQAAADIALQEGVPGGAVARVRARGPHFPLSPTCGGKYKDPDVALIDPDSLGELGNVIRGVLRSRSTK